MQIPILVEPIEGGRYRARAGEPFVCCAEGDTKVEAFQALERQLKERLRDGLLLTVELPLSRPELLYSGIYDPNDQISKDLREAIAEYRRQVDEGPDI